MFLLLNEKIIFNASFNGSESVRYTQDNTSAAITRAVPGFFIFFKKAHAHTEQQQQLNWNILSSVWIFNYPALMWYAMHIHLY